MSDRGTPLKKFGLYQVRQLRWGSYPSWSVCDINDEQICYSTVKASAYFVAEKLASGLPIVSPQESLDNSMSLYPSLYPCKLRYYDHLFLTNGNGMDWINGGLCESDVTRYTAEGLAWYERKEREREEAEEARSPGHKARLDRYMRDHDAEDIFGPSDATIRKWYAEGTWPDVLPPREPKSEWLRGMGSRWGYTKLYPASDRYCTLWELAAQDHNPTEEWLECARTGCRIILTHGTNDPERKTEDTVGKVREWATTCQAKYGGVWLPQT